MKKQARYKKEEEKMFETVLRSGLDVEGLIEAEEEEERRKSSVKGASAQAFNERGVLSQDESTYQNDGSEDDLNGGGGDVEEEEEIAPIAKFQLDEHLKEEREK
ncbi:uncharacterized protein MONOS_9854 [Monocercomonoides exilis]|nr:hypothetical protein MONOS_9854 [Monocercomonoides exilis]